MQHSHQLSYAALHPEVHARMVPLCAQKGLHIQLLPTEEALAKAKSAGWDIDKSLLHSTSKGKALWVEGLDDHTPGLPIVVVPVARSRIVPDGRLVGVEPIAPTQHPRDARVHMQALIAAEEAAHAQQQGATRPTYGRTVCDVSPLDKHLTARLRTAEWFQEVGPEQGPCPDPLPRQGVRVPQDMDLRSPNGHLQAVPKDSWILQDQEGRLSIAAAEARFHALGPAPTPARVLEEKAAFAVQAARAIQASANGLGVLPAQDGPGGSVVADRQDGRILVLATFAHLSDAQAATQHNTERYLDKRASWRNAYQKGKEIAAAYKQAAVRG